MGVVMLKQVFGFEGSGDKSALRRILSKNFEVFITTYFDYRSHKSPRQNGASTDLKHY